MPPRSSKENYKKKKSRKDSLPTTLFLSFRLRPDITPTQNLITLSKETQLHWRPSLSAYSTLPSTKSFGEGKGNPLQYSCLENPMDRGAWKAAVHGVAKSRARLSLFTFTFHFHALEKEMATHSSILAWNIPGTEEPNRLPSMGSHRLRQD